MAQIRDLNLSMTAHSVTGDISSLTNFSAIRRSLDMLIKMHKLDKPFQEDIGSDISLSLFDVLSSADINALKTRIRSLIERNETRIRLVSIEAVAIPSTNTVELTIEYIIKKTSQSDRYTAVLNLSE